MKREKLLLHPASSRHSESSLFSAVMRIKKAHFDGTMNRNKILANFELMSEGETGKDFIRP